MISVIVPLISNVPERLQSVSELLLKLSYEFSEITVHILPRLLKEIPDKIYACKDISNTILNIKSSEWIIFIEDDVEIGTGFGKSVYDGIDHIKDNADIGAIALFSPRRLDEERLRRGEKYYIDKHQHFRQTQAVLMTAKVANLWAEKLQQDNLICYDWDIILGDTCKENNLSILIALPSTAQHRGFENSLLDGFKSTFGHRNDGVVSHTFVK